MWNVEQPSMQQLCDFSKMSQNIKDETLLRRASGGVPGDRSRTDRSMNKTRKTIVEYHLPCTTLPDQTGNVSDGDHR